MTVADDPFHLSRMKQGFGQIVLDILSAIIPPVGVALNDMKIRHLSTLVDRLALSAAGALTQIDSELIALEQC